MVVHDYNGGRAGLNYIDAQRLYSSAKLYP